MQIDVITGFPEIVTGPVNASIIKKGQESGAVKIQIHNLRDYTEDRHRTIDDYPYGGGPGMVLKLEPFVLCLEEILAGESDESYRILMLSPKGEEFNQDKAIKLTLKDHLIFLCGHYKGIDERIHEFFKIEEISVGDYILSSGEIGALVIIDSVVRLLPGVIRDIDSAWTDSFTDDLLDAPYYTRPEEFRGIRVPDVLLSGNHEKIDTWRFEQKKNLTEKKRPDLYKKYRNH